MRQFAFYTSVLGMLQIEYEGEYVTGIKIIPDKQVVGGEESELTQCAYLQINEYLKAKRQQFDLPYRFKGGANFNERYGLPWNVSPTRQG